MKITVIFIAGSTRSGSTLLDRVLGQIDGFFSIGEVRGAWDAFAGNWLCECGEHLRDCKFWSTVVKQSFGNFDRVDWMEIKAIQRRISRIRYLPAHVFPYLSTRQFGQRVNAYLAILQRFYEAISTVSGSRTIIDSSKNPTDALLLNSLSNIDLKVIHLVRDSRAVAYSWQRRKQRPEVTSDIAYQNTYRPLNTALRWSVVNVATEFLKYTVSSYMRVNYEDFSRSPREVVFHMLNELKLGNHSLDFFLDEHTVMTVPGHTVFGNPMRMQRGIIKIQPDVEWQYKMPVSQKFLVTLLSWPLLWRYDYI